MLLPVEEVKRILKLRGVNFEGFAAMLDRHGVRSQKDHAITAPYLSQLVTRHRYPSGELAIGICKVIRAEFGVDVDPGSLLSKALQKTLHAVNVAFCTPDSN